MLIFSTRSEEMRTKKRTRASSLGLEKLNNMFTETSGMKTNITGSLCDQFHKWVSTEDCIRTGPGDEQRGQLDEQSPILRIYIYIPCFLQYVSHSKLLSNLLFFYFTTNTSPNNNQLNLPHHHAHYYCRSPFYPMHLGNSGSSCSSYD